MKTLAELSTTELDAVVGGFSPVDRRNFLGGKMYGIIAGLTKKAAQANGLAWLKLGREYGGKAVNPSPPLLNPR